MKVLLAILLLVLLAGAVQAEFYLPLPLTLEAKALQSLSNGERVGCMSVSSQVGSMWKLPIEANLLLPKDFTSSGKWGLGLAAPIGKDSPFKLGLGVMPGMKGPVATLSFKIL